MRFAGLGLAVPFLVASLLSAQAQAPAAPAPNPQTVAAQSAFDALPEAERRAIQTDLIWAGAFNGAVSGSFGPLTFRGINTIKAASKGAPDGILTPAERKALAQRAAAARDAAGFRLIADERTGARIGIPMKLLPEARRLAGRRALAERGWARDARHQRDCARSRYAGGPVRARDQRRRAGA